MRYAFVLLAACSATPRSSTVAGDAGGFAAASDAIVAHLHAIEPADAVSQGLHDFDGKLPDVSPAGLDRAVAQLRADLAQLDQLAPPGVLQREERAVLRQSLHERLFNRIDLDAYRTNPMTYTGAINLDAYIIRDYAPAAQRAAAVISLCKALPAYLTQARANLRPPMPRTWIDTALLQTKGYVDFVDHDIRDQLAPAGVAELAPALEACKAALTEHATWLTQQQAQATQAFALGADKFIRMLAETQGVTTDLAALRVLIDADLKRNLAAMTEAAHAIDPKRPVAEVVAAAAEDKPAADQVLPEATAQAAMLRKFIVEHDVITIPTDDVAMVRPSPAFQRWNAAFLDSPGPFEKTKLPAYYYISPPDPAWPAAEQRAYLPARADMLFTTVHEVYPGHFIHSLHMRRNPSRILQSFWTYSTGEGWAHYAEEMMFDAGAGDHTPKARIGMLKEALLRDVRFLVALGEHTAGMTVDQATQLFRDQAFVDPGNARRQAVRGTFDPMYLSYTLGKLMIRKLHTDWLASHPGASLAAFHDAFLAHGCAPIPVIRAAMLGPQGGPAI
ncbi:MAG TPA: DUF885 domain-containing protein [Kofleriaceae bacterium]